MPLIYLCMVLFQWFVHMSRLFLFCQHLQSFPLLSSIELVSIGLPISNTVKRLGMILDSKLTFRPHITSLLLSRLNTFHRSFGYEFVASHSLLTCHLLIIQNSLAGVVVRVLLRTIEHVPKSYYIGCIFFLLYSE